MQETIINGCIYFVDQITKEVFVKDYTKGDFLFVAYNVNELNREK